MTITTTHDQNFKNLILDYPRQALEFFAKAEAEQIDDRVRIVYVDFIDIYAGLDEDERAAYQRQYPQEAEIMETFASRFEERGVKKGFEKGLQQGLQQGVLQGRRQGEAEVLMRLLERKFGPPTEEQRHRILEADADTLLRWAERVLTADRIEDVLAP